MKGYDEKYLQSCIDKAKKSWEGIDTDKFMNEVRGREDAPDQELDDVAIFKAIDYTDGLEDGGTEKHPWNDEDVEKAYREGMKAGAEWQREQYECIPTEESYMRGFAQGAKEEREDIITRIRNQVKLWMPDNPEGDEYEAGKRLAFASVLQYLKELEAQQDDICSGCINVKGCVTCVNGNMKETSEDKELEEAAERYEEENTLQLYDGGERTNVCLKDVFVAGAKWQKGQMIKEAVDKNGLELNYKRISRDYKLLKDLLDEGYKIIGVAWGELEIFYKDVPHEEYSMGGTIPTANEPFCKDEIKRDFPDGYFGYFEKACAIRQIQFIIPNGKFTKEGYEQAEKEFIPLINRLCEAILFEWKDAADLARKTLTQIKTREEE